jgi:endo-1,4-beta-xylanase
VSITGKGDWKGKAKASYEITRAVNPLKIIKNKSAIVSCKNLKKKSRTLSLRRILKVSGQQGPVTFGKISGNKGIGITASGKVILKKGLGKNMYIVKVILRAAGNGNYKPVSKTVKCRIVVR